MRTIGSQHRCDIELDPVKAFRRANALDAALRSTLPPWPRGIWRATHAAMNRQDDERALAAARLVNRP